MPQTTNSKFENYLWTKNSSIAFIALDSLWMEVAKKCAKFVVFLIWNLNFAKTTGYVSSIIVWVNVLVLLRSWTTFRYCGLFLRTETLCGEVGRYCMFVWMILMNFVWMIDSVLTFCCNKVVHWDLGWKNPVGSFGDLKWSLKKNFIHFRVLLFSADKVSSESC